MRRKTSITLAEEIVEALDEAVGPGSNRSRVIEEAVVDFLARRKRAEREARDLAILNRRAESLNREVQDVLGYQADV